MTIFKTEGLTPMQAGRLAAALDKLHRRDGIVRTLRAHIEADAAAGPLRKSETDGMIDYNRVKFNRMNHAEQRAYEARLKAKRYYVLNGFDVPKIVFDAVKTEEVA